MFIPFDHLFHAQRAWSSGLFLWLGLCLLNCRFRVLFTYFQIICSRKVQTSVFLFFIDKLEIFILIVLSNKSINVHVFHVNLELIIIQSTKTNIHYIVEVIKGWVNIALIIYNKPQKNFFSEWVVVCSCIWLVQEAYICCAFIQPGRYDCKLLN